MVPPRRREGHETAHCSLSLSVPAATQLRQLAVLHALKEALPGTCWLENVAAVNERLPDIKGALRHALGAQLGRALGWQVCINCKKFVWLIICTQRSIPGQIEYAARAGAAAGACPQLAGVRETFCLPFI